MARFIQLTNESGSKVSINVDAVISFAPMGGDALRGTVISFGFSAGDKATTRSVRVAETYDQVTTAFTKTR